MFAPAYSGFPVEFAGAADPHATFLNESRTRGCWWGLVQEIRIHGQKAMLFTKQKRSKGLRPSSSAHVRWGEHGAPVQNHGTWLGG
jgi:hypothetical protein